MASEFSSASGFSAKKRVTFPRRSIFVGGEVDDHCVGSNAALFVTMRSIAACIVSICACLESPNVPQEFLFHAQDQPSARAKSRGRNKVPALRLISRGRHVGCYQQPVSHVVTATEPANPRRYTKGRRLRSSDDRLRSGIQSSVGLLPRRFRRVLDIRQQPDSRSKERHDGAHPRFDVQRSGHRTSARGKHGNGRNLKSAQALSPRRWNSARSGTVPTRAARRKSRAAFLLIRFERIERDGQTAQIHPDGNPAGPRPD